jgi:RluA family pseudouridine synthase
VIKLSSPSTGGFWQIPILHEDEHLLALDKPAGLLTSPDRDDPQQPCLMKLLHTGIAEGKPWAKERGLVYLMNSHRLDFETSGVLLLAKSKPVLIQLANLFGTEKPAKQYLALVRGAPKEDTFAMDARLLPHALTTGLLCVAPKRGKRSRTLVRVLERFAGYALLQCEPVTGWTHQVRAHLRHAGLPLVADALYGGRPLFLSRFKPDYHPNNTEPERPLIGRVALHAERLQLPHPVTGEPLGITAPWPKDLTVAVKYLRRFAQGNTGGRGREVPEC